MPAGASISKSTRPETMRPCRARGACSHRRARRRWRAGRRRRRRCSAGQIQRRLDARVTGLPMAGSIAPARVSTRASRGPADLAAELGDGARVERAVGVGGRLRAREAADVHGRHDLGVAPRAVVEVERLPAVREAPRIEDLHRHAAADGIGSPVVPVARPRHRPCAPSSRVADQPAGRAQVGLEDEDAAAAQHDVGRGRHPEGFGRAVVFHVDADRCCRRGGGRAPGRPGRSAGAAAGCGWGRGRPPAR